MKDNQRPGAEHGFAARTPPLRGRQALQRDRALYDRIRSAALVTVWTSLARARELELDPLATAQPLFGVPLAIKDNIDFVDLPTIAGYRGYVYSPDGTATVVEALVDAGAIPIGKTNLDQFAFKKSI